MVCFLSHDARAQEPNPEADPAAPSTSSKAGQPPSAAPQAPQTKPNVDTQPPSKGLQPPRLLRSQPPVYPESQVQSQQHPTVVVEVTVSDKGRVLTSRIEHSASSDFDLAALDAVRKWQFAPATRDGKPITSRVRVAVHFELPGFDFATLLEGSTPAASAPAASASQFSAKAEVKHAALRSKVRGASHYAIERKQIEAAPRSEGAEILRSAPGVYVARAEGDAVGHRIMLRGFDADHGQDLELKLGGLPLNLPSHIHGQGYTDLGLLIAESVEEVEITEGVSDPRQGDFAVAGTVDFHLRAPMQGFRSKTAYGSFATFRQLLMWSPPNEDRETFAAVQYRKTEGFGDNRAGASASAIVQNGFEHGAWHYRVIGVLYGARSSFAGVLRKDDIDSGRVDYYDVYPFATAEKQNAFSGRLLIGTIAEYRGVDGDNAEVGAFVGYDNFRLQENFTGFIQRSQTLANQAGRGDLIEQANRTSSGGLLARYRTAPYAPAAFAKGTVELGLAGRLDIIRQTQNLLDANVNNQTWDRRVDASIRAGDLGFYGDLDWDFFKHLTLRAGLRADMLYYDVEDRLFNVAPLIRAGDTFIPGYRRSALGLVWGPRTSAEVRPLKWLTVLTSYGEGYRSPQARTLDDGEKTPFTKVRSADVGVRMRYREFFEVMVSGFYTHLSDDIAFDAEEGRPERIGATRRLGSTLRTSWTPNDWLLSSFSATYVDAELLQPPPPTVEEPQPAFRSGQNLPYIPPLVLRLDLGARGVLNANLQGQKLIGRVSSGFSYLSARPLPFGQFADPVALIDASAALGWGPFELGIEAFNLLDQRYAASEFNFASHWSPDASQSRVPARHIAAGAPLTVMATLQVTL